jgi:arabinose-5-phosphate isomerase
VAPTDTVGDSLVTMTRGRLGLILVMNGDRLLGLVTDGDLRRAMQRHSDLLRLPVTEIMTRNPVTIDENTLLDDAHQRMQAMKLKALVVVGDEGKVTGIVEVFDEK